MRRYVWNSKSLGKFETRDYIGNGRPPVDPEKTCGYAILETELCENFLPDSFIESQADIAEEPGGTRARVSQGTDFTSLVPKSRRNS